MEQLPLDPIDIALLLILLVGAWRGFVKGLVLSIASLVGLVGGFWAAQHVSHLTAAQLAPHVTWSEQTLCMASLALTFLMVVVAVHLLAKLLERLLDEGERVAQRGQHRPREGPPDPAKTAARTESVGRVQREEAKGRERPIQRGAPIVPRRTLSTAPR